MNKMDLNRFARQWLREHRHDLFERTDLHILAAQPHPVRMVRNGREFTYQRWSWNTHVHNQERKNYYDFLLMQMDEDGKLLKMYLVPRSKMNKKTVCIYLGGKMPRYNWLTMYRINLQ